MNKDKNLNYYFEEGLSGAFSLLAGFLMGVFLVYLAISGILVPVLIGSLIFVTLSVFIGIIKKPVIYRYSITDIPSHWGEKFGYGQRQHRFFSGVFTEDDGKTYYLVGENPKVYYTPQKFSRG